MLSHIEFANDVSPDSENDVGNIELTDIVDVGSLQLLMDHFQKLIGMIFAILDLKGNVLVAAGWQDICVWYHREHPETSRRCRESDINRTKDVEPGKFKLYRCKNKVLPGLEWVMTHNDANWLAPTKGPLWTPFFTERTLQPASSNSLK